MYCSSMHTRVSRLHMATAACPPVSSFSSTPRAATRVARPGPSQRRYINSLLSQQGGNVNENGLWLPPTRKRDAVKAQASNNGFNMAKIKVRNSMRCIQL